MSVLKDALVRGEGCCHVNDQNWSREWWDSALAEYEALRAALERSESDWTFLANLHPDVPLAPEVREALAVANLRLIRTVDALGAQA